MKKTLMVLIVALCLAAVAQAGEGGRGGVVPADSRCPVCGMSPARYPDWNTEVEFADGSRAFFEGPKDMFKYYLDIRRYNPQKGRGDVVRVEVRDYPTKARIDARRAFFVIWGDVFGPMGYEPVPFGKEEDAREFLKAHKGKEIVKFDGITPKLLDALDNP